MLLLLLVKRKQGQKEQNKKGGKMFLQQFNQKTSHKIKHGKKGEKAKKCLLGDLGSSRGPPHTQKNTKKRNTSWKERRKKPCSFQSGELLLCALYYGGRNSRHKSCCRPRQKTCLNYKVTRKNNQKKKKKDDPFWALSSLSKSLSGCVR